MAGTRALLLYGGGLVLLGAVAGALYPHGQYRTASVPVLADPACHPLEQTCTVQIASGTLALHITGPVAALQAFPVAVRVDSATPPERVSVRFDMVGMDMGSNRFVLQPTAGVWQGQAVLPVCSAGRQDWQVTVEVIGAPAYTAVFALTVP